MNAIIVRDVHKTFHVTNYPIRSLKEALIHLLPGHRANRASKKVEALRGVSFEVPLGESLAILGPNGSGKSTLMRILTGTFQADTGTVEIKGRLAPLLQIGAGFNPELTGRENAMMACSMYGLRPKAIRRMMPDIVAFSELDEFMDKPMKYYSSGMQARLGFATAIHLDADILMIDEALAVGDAAFQKKCLARIRSLQEAGTSLVLVSHSPEMVREFCDHCIVLENGHIVARGTVDEVLAGADA